jgi:hypothetical protein
MKLENLTIITKENECPLNQFDGEKYSCYISGLKCYFPSDINKCPAYTYRYKDKPKLGTGARLVGGY